MKALTVPLLLIAIVACSEPQLEPENPAKKKLDSLFLQQPPNEYQLTVEVQALFNGTSHTETVTQYVSGESFKTSNMQEINGRPITFESYMINGEFISCMRNITWDCQKVPEGEPPETVDEFTPQFEEPTITELPGREVAGLRTSCFLLQYREGKEELCLTNGIVGYRSVTFGEDTITEKVTSFSASVPTDAFAPPVEVQG